MSKITLSKKNRMFTYSVKDGITKNEVILKPIARKPITVTYEGITLTTLVAPGQHINPRKEIKREMARRTEAYKNNK